MTDTDAGHPDQDLPVPQGTGPDLPDLRGLPYSASTAARTRSPTENSPPTYANSG
ncbi:hypothetical protein BTZ20_2780 [Rhodococcus sp. MTM3W5.2]|nr:hypothetical protein BTZ20_2780 [Rhodococcus sp. MTM3W5.2]